MEIKDATPLSLAQEWNFLFKSKQHKIHDTRGSEKFNYLIM